jgi:hypothetical protein
VNPGRYSALHTGQNMTEMVHRTRLSLSCLINAAIVHVKYWIEHAQLAGRLGVFRLWRPEEDEAVERVRASPRRSDRK